MLGVEAQSPVTASWSDPDHAHRRSQTTLTTRRRGSRKQPSKGIVRGKSSKRRDPQKPGVGRKTTTKKHRSQPASRKPNQNQWTREIIRFLREKAPRPLCSKELAKSLKVSAEDYTRFDNTLVRLEERGKILRVRGNRFTIPKDLGLVIGRLQTIGSGSGFVISEGEEQDVFVRSRDLGSAVHGDRVTVRIEEQEHRGPRGTIIDVVERRHDRLVGVLKEHKGRQWMEVTEPRLDLEVSIPNRDVGDAGSGDVIVAEIINWGDTGPGPVGRVDQVLGQVGDPGLDVLAIQIGFGLANEFPEQVEDLAKIRQQSGIQPEDFEGRKDCRTQRTMTIDPADAKDHDDALSIEQLENGNMRIGVHIADVSHYVQEGDPIDREAWERGTSVYLVDRVLPMLPHSLSNDSCSLRPGEDRLTMAVFFEVDGQGLLQNTQFAKAVIKSSHKLSYEDAQSIIDGNETEATRQDPGLRTDLRELLRASEILRRHRHDRGSIDFDLPESHIILGADGAPVDVQRHERTLAHMLVEDLMIATNEAVANWAIEQGIPALYRIHEYPDDASLETLRLVVAEFGHSLPMRKAKPRDFQRLIDSVNGRPEQDVISVQVLRSLSRARYLRTNEGHFGLASPAYVHFTSPIRRYPDLVIHRQLSSWLTEPRSARSISLEWLDATAQQATTQEQIATEAARDSVNLKKVEFMERHLGDHFTGTISGVTPFGCFVRLDSYDIEGLIHISNLGKDYFVHDGIKHTLRDRRTKTTYTLGDAIEVQVSRVDREARRIDLMPLP